MPELVGAVKALEAEQIAPLLPQVEALAAGKSADGSGGAVSEAVKAAAAKALSRWTQLKTAG